jgi:hypothetical protein
VRERNTNKRTALADELMCTAPADAHARALAWKGTALADALMSRAQDRRTLMACSLHRRTHTGRAKQERQSGRQADRGGQKEGGDSSVLSFVGAGGQARADLHIGSEEQSRRADLLAGAHAGGRAGCMHWLENRRWKVTITI